MTSPGKKPGVAFWATAVVVVVLVGYDPRCRVTLRRDGSESTLNARSQFVPQGKIKKIVGDRGFGFIETERGTDLFFHHSEVKEGSFDHLQVGDRVDFTESSGKKGPCATDVRPVK
ncbi:MAG: cold-shock protein [Deltaproteobacteria bacterium]